MRAQKLLLVDDEEQLRLLVKQILINHQHIEVVDVSSALEALEYLKGNRVNAILTDIKMPGMDGLDFIKKVNESGLKVPTIFYSGFADKEMAIKALRLGAFEFIEKPFGKADLITAVTNALLQETLSTTSRLEKLGLNSTQLNVLEMLICGRSNKEIGQVVSLTEQAIKYHVGVMLEKFGAKNRIELRDLIWKRIDH